MGRSCVRNIVRLQGACVQQWRLRREQLGHDQGAYICKSRGLTRAPAMLFLRLPVSQPRCHRQLRRKKSIRFREFAMAWLVCQDASGGSSTSIVLARGQAHMLVGMRCSSAPGCSAGCSKEVYSVPSMEGGNAVGFKARQLSFCSCHDSGLDRSSYTKMLHLKQLLVIRFVRSTGTTAAPLP